MCIFESKYGEAVRIYRRELHGYVSCWRVLIAMPELPRDPRLKNLPVLV